MGFLSVIRRWALRDKMPIREIARRTGLSRNTIKKYLREDAVEPKFKTPSRPSKLDPYADRLSAWLLAQTRKSRKERRNVKLMYEDLVKLGYDGSYERVAAFARAWRADRHRAEQTTGRGTFVPLVFEPGEAFQFDWSEDWATIGGERVKLQVAHTKLSHSRAFIVRVYPLQTHEMLFDAHWHAFRVFGGIPGRGIYDNMKTAVDRVGRGKQRDVNARFKADGTHNRRRRSAGRCSTSHFYLVANPCPALLRNSRSVGHTVHALAETRSRSVGRYPSALTTVT